MHKDDLLVERYLGQVEAAMEQSRVALQERRLTLSMLREQIEEALAAGGAPAQVISAMDPPTAFAPGAGPKPQPRSVLGLVGLWSGLALATAGLGLIPLFAPHLRSEIGNPLVLGSAIVLLASGVLGRHTSPGKMSLMLGLMISAFIAMATLFLALSA